MTQTRLISLSSATPLARSRGKEVEPPGKEVELRRKEAEPQGKEKELQGKELPCMN